MSSEQQALPGITPPPPIKRTKRGKRGTQPNGYAAPPGSGPVGKTCKSCEFYRRVHTGSNVYRKCGEIRQAWTHGPGTDIKASAEACVFYQEYPDNGCVL